MKYKTINELRAAFLKEHPQVQRKPKGDYSTDIRCAFDLYDRITIRTPYGDIKLAITEGFVEAYLPQEMNFLHFRIKPTIRTNS